MRDEHPRRRQADGDRRRWPDERLDDLADTVRSFAPLVKQVGVAESELKQHDEELTAIRQSVRDVAKVCEDFHAEYRADQKHAKTANRAVVIAMIGSSATVIAAVIAAIAVILTGGN